MWPDCRYPRHEHLTPEQRYFGPDGKKRFGPEPPQSREHSVRQAVGSCTAPRWVRTKDWKIPGWPDLRIAQIMIEPGLVPDPAALADPATKLKALL
jgi:hypothetical protein